MTAFLRLMTLTRRTLQKKEAPLSAARAGPRESAGNLRAGEAPGGTRARPQVKTLPPRKTCAGSSPLHGALTIGSATGAVTGGGGGGAGTGTLGTVTAGSAGAGTGFAGETGTGGGAGTAGAVGTGGSATGGGAGTDGAAGTGGGDGTDGTA